MTLVLVALRLLAGMGGMKKVMSSLDFFTKRNDSMQSLGIPQQPSAENLLVRSRVKILTVRREEGYCYSVNCSSDEGYEYSLSCSLQVVFDMDHTMVGDLVSLSDRDNIETNVPWTYWPEGKEQGLSPTFILSYLQRGMLRPGLLELLAHLRSVGATIVVYTHSEEKWAIKVCEAMERMAGWPFIKRCVAVSSAVCHLRGVALVFVVAWSVSCLCLHVAYPSFMSRMLS